MTTRAQQEGYLASIAQAYDVGDFDYLPPDELQSLNGLIAEVWKIFKQNGDVDAQISQIKKAIGRDQ
jgi:hypothetical protein